MASLDHDHLATITPIDPSESRQLMNTFSLLKTSFCFIAFQTAWIWLGLISAMIYNPLDSVAKVIGTIGLLLACVWLVMQFAMVFVYPEWPINGFLCRKLRRCIEGRLDRPNWVIDSELRVVELVPRERWSKMALETATDLLVIRIDSAGVKMEGDCDRYELPCASILGADLHTMRPSGWFADTYMVIVTARTDQGMVELPISYRDHRMGRLRHSRRRMDALDLAEQINRIATGAAFQSIFAPSSDSLLPEMDRSNPYASPAQIEL